MNLKKDKDMYLYDLQYHEDEKAQRIIDCIPNDVAGFQVNINKIPKGQITAWHRHIKNEDTFVVIQGSFKIGLVYQGFFLTDTVNVEWIILDAVHDSKKSIYIPPLVWHGVVALEDNSIILYYMKNGYDREDIQERPIGYFGETW